MAQPDFQTIDAAAPAPGLVLRIGKIEIKYLRLTHVFSDCAYVMWVGGPADARFARRPTRKPLSELIELAGDPGTTWGRLTLPPALSASPKEKSERSEQLNTAWSLVKPLVEIFKNEANLDRSRFTALIRARADATQTSFITLQRMLLRYYYFGGTRLALLPLPPGVKAGNAAYPKPETKDSGTQSPPKRRGRQPRLAAELGANDFIVSEDDISDMVECLKKCLRRGPTYKTTAHEEYLAGHFRRRHPDVHAEYIANKRVEPVTAKQYRYYVDSRAQLTEALAKNLRTQERNPGHLGSLLAAGPAELYEIDSTGGRIYLVSTDDPPVLVGKPTIYLLIDRWSRFVPSVFITLGPPSYEGVRYTLMIAFTSREARFQALGANIDDVRWPVGRIPAAICPDRGSDFMCDSMEQAIVQDLRIELTPLPPYCPDGKAIVERLIRELKRRMPKKDPQWDDFCDTYWDYNIWVPTGGETAGNCGQAASKFDRVMRKHLVTDLTRTPACAANAADEYRWRCAVSRIAAGGHAVQSRIHLRSGLVVGHAACNKLKYGLVSAGQ